MQNVLERPAQKKAGRPRVPEHLRKRKSPSEINRYQVGTRFQPWLYASLEAFCAHNRCTKPEAVRRLVKHALTTPTPAPQRASIKREECSL